MCSPIFTSPGNWYLLACAVLACAVGLTYTDNQPCSDTRGDVNLHLNSAKCVMAEGSDITHGPGDCSPQSDLKFDQTVNEYVKPSVGVTIQPGHSWPGQSGQHIRSPLARTIYQKMREDELNKNNRHIYWYRVILSRFSEDVQRLFLQLEQDESTDEFLQNCQEKSDQIFTQIFYSVARPVLNLFMTQTSINGFLNRGSMFIFSENQFEKLMQYSGYHKGENLLDLGAGDGMVSLRMSRYFNNTYATEMSTTMVRRLAGHGFTVLGVDEWHNSGLQFDLVACLNLLDRCDKPLSLLSDIRKTLKPVTGRALVAVVIPFKPYVEFESKTHLPTEYLHVSGSNFEEEINKFIKVFHQSGFEVERFTRLPYLCEGDLKHSFYVLTDAVFVLRLADSKPVLQHTDPPS